MVEPNQVWSRAEWRLLWVEQAASTPLVRELKKDENFPRNPSRLKLAWN